MRSIAKFIGSIVTVILLVLLFAFYVRIKSYEDSFDVRDVSIAGSIPAQLFLPDAEKPPVVIVAHGFTADKEMMQSLAYTLVRDGFAVITFDFRGHGQNATDFDHNRLQEDMAHVVAFARNLNEDMPQSFGQGPKEVDTRRIALIGHSMGGGAVVNYGFRHPRIDATVPVAGVFGPVSETHPKNLFIIYAENDPQDLIDAAWRMLRDGVDEENLAADTTYGSFGLGTARRLSEVPGTDHITILFSMNAHEQIRDWLRQTWDMPPNTVKPSDPRLAWMGWMYLLAFLLFFGLCSATAWYLPAIPQRTGREVVLNLVAFAVVCFVTLFVNMLAPPLSFITMPVGDNLVSYFFVAGAIFFLVAARRGNIDFSHFKANAGRTMFAALALFLIVYLTFGAIATEVWFRQLLTLQRLFWALLILPLLLPFFIAFEASFKRGNTLVALVASLIGVFIALGMLVAGVALGVADGFLMLIIIPMAICNVIFQLFAVYIYHLSRNYFITAIFNAFIMAWQYAVLFPLS
ncbi:MAG: alpha/beta fold hydrolase [Candidatus Abyssubacteria bacterium]